MGISTLPTIQPADFTGFLEASFGSEICLDGIFSSYYTETLTGWFIWVFGGKGISPGFFSIGKIPRNKSKQPPGSSFG